MYEEDRLNALAMYSRIFDDAEDEQTLLNRLVSPTRQAVIVARSYNAKEHKLQVHAQSRDESAAAGSGATPDYVCAINQVAEEIFAEQRKTPEVDANQLSLFEETPDADEPAAVETVPEAEPVEVPQVADEPVEETPEEAESAQDAPVSEPEKPASEPDQIDAFLSDFAIPAEVLAMQDAPAPTEPAESDESVGSEPEESACVPFEAEEESFSPEEEPADDREDEPVLKAKVFALIVYILFAIPVTLAGIVLLLIPTVAVLALAVVAIAGGIFLFSSAFSGFAIFADIMMVLGGAIVLLALGLLFLWLFIWFIGGAMAGLVRGVIELGKKWCYKEVEAA